MFVPINRISIVVIFVKTIATCFFLLYFIFNHIVKT